MLMQFKLLFSCVQFQWQPSPFAHSCIANHRLWHEANRGKAILQRGKCGTLTAAGRVEHIWPCSLGVHCPNPSARLQGEERGVLTPPNSSVGMLALSNIPAHSPPAPALARSTNVFISQSLPQGRWGHHLKGQHKPVSEETWKSCKWCRILRSR